MKRTISPQYWLCATQVDYEMAQKHTIINELKNRKTFIKTKELISILDLTKNTLCKYVREGKIAAVRIGNGNGFDPMAVVAYLEAREL